MTGTFATSGFSAVLGLLVVVVGGFLAWHGAKTNKEAHDANDDQYGNNLTLEGVPAIIGGIALIISGVVVATAPFA